MHYNYLQFFAFFKAFQFHIIIITVSIVGLISVSHSASAQFTPVCATYNWTCTISFDPATPLVGQSVTISVTASNPDSIGWYSGPSCATVNFGDGNSITHVPVKIDTTTGTRTFSVTHTYQTAVVNLSVDVIFWYYDQIDGVDCLNPYISVEAPITIQAQGGTGGSSNETQGGNSCPLHEKIGIQAQDSTTLQAFSIVTPGQYSTLNLLMNASNKNVDRLDVILEARFNVTSNGQDVTPDQIQRSFAENDFFVLPGEVKTIPLTFRISPSFQPANVTYSILAAIKDAYGCSVATNPLNVTVIVRSGPDFSLSANPRFVSLDRESTFGTESAITAIATNNTFGPMKLNFLYAGWNQSLQAKPSFTKASFGLNPFIAIPGANETRILTIQGLEAPPSTQDSQLSYYYGNFTYTIVVQGIWFENGQQFNVTKHLDIPVNISRIPYDFLISSPSTVLYIDPNSSNSSAQITVSHLNGRNEIVSLHSVGFNPDLNIKFGKSQGTPDFVTNMIVKYNVLQLTSKQITVEADSGGRSHTLTFQLSTAPFRLSISPERSLITPNGILHARVYVTNLLPNSRSDVKLDAKLVQSPQSPVTYPDSPFLISLDKSQGQIPFSANLSISLRPASNPDPRDYAFIISASSANYSDSKQIVLSLQSTQSTVFIDTEPRIDDTVVVDGAPVSVTGLNSSRSWGSGETHIVYAMPQIYHGNDTRYIFESWNDGSTLNNRTIAITNRNIILVAHYNPQYLLTLESPYGKVSGNGWYNSNSSTIIGLTPTSVVDSSGFTLKFSGWKLKSPQESVVSCGQQSSADTKTQSQNATQIICVDGPKTLSATWEIVSAQYDIAPILYAVGGIGFSVVVSVLHFFVQKPLPKLHFQSKGTHHFTIDVNADLER